MSITIRPIREADRAQWEALFRAYIRFYKEKIADDIIAATWKRVLAQEDGMLGLVVEEEDARLVGLAHMVFHRSTWSPTVYCYLEDMFVDIDTRRKGVGRALVEAVYREADNRGATRTYWATMADNATARRLYDRLGKLSPFVQYRR